MYHVPCRCPDHLFSLFQCRAHKSCAECEHGVEIPQSDMDTSETAGLILLVFLHSPLAMLIMNTIAFIGNDHPEDLAILRRAVRMTVEESVHYGITQPEAEIEWLYTAPLGDNDVRLGTERRLFAVAMFHELHCLRGIREALDGGLASLPALLQGHVNHCFNYLRQWTLCGADVTLEPGDFSQRNFTTERTGATHTCPDWEPVYEMVGANWFEWERFREASGLPPFVDTGLD